MRLINLRAKTTLKDNLKVTKTLKLKEVKVCQLKAVRDFFERDDGQNLKAIFKRRPVEPSVQNKVSKIL